MEFCGAEPTIRQGSLKVGELEARERPEGLKAAFEQARFWAKYNNFITALIKINRGFILNKAQVVARDPAQQGELDKWKERETEDCYRGDLLEKITEDIVQEFLIQDTAISFWKRAPADRDFNPPVLFMPENCKYKNAMWTRSLRVNMKLSESDFKDSGLSQEEIDRYTKGEFVPDEDRNEFFRVLTRQIDGFGLNEPTMVSALRTLSQADSMEVGESQLAYAGRSVIRHHKIGFEVKNTNMALRQFDFLYDKVRASDIKKSLGGRQGFMDLITQFDHEILFSGIPDPKHYDARKWETIIARVSLWAGPAAYMLYAKSVSPFLLKLLKAIIEADRRMLARHIEWVINKSMMGTLDAPLIKIVWDNRIFEDARLAWDQVKTLMMQGPLSLETSLEEGGFNPQMESKRKKREAPDSRDEELLPKFSAAQGLKPGQVAGGASWGDKAGRRPGIPDGGNVQA